MFAELRVGMGTLFGENISAVIHELSETTLGCARSGDLGLVLRDRGLLEPEHRRGRQGRFRRAGVDGPRQAQAADLVHREPSWLPALETRAVHPHIHRLSSFGFQPNGPRRPVSHFTL